MRLTDEVAIRELLKMKAADEDRKTYSEFGEGQVNGSVRAIEWCLAIFYGISIGHQFYDSFMEAVDGR